MNNKKLLLLAAVLALGASLAHAADYADVAAATTAVTGIPTTVSPVFLAFLTLGVGAFIIRMVIKYARKGSAV